MHQMTKMTPAAKFHALGSGRRATLGLKWAAAIYALTVGLHVADHVRRGLEVLTPEVRWAGTASILATIVTVALTFLGSRVAPAFAAFVGLASAVGIVAVHLLPRWSSFSDAFPGAHVDAASWAAILLQFAGALALGFIGLAGVREAAR